MLFGKYWNSEREIWKVRQMDETPLIRSQIIPTDKTKDIFYRWIKEESSIDFSGDQ